MNKAISSKNKLIPHVKPGQFLLNIVDTKKKSQLPDLTSRFYTLIPHDFGRQRPPVINTLEVAREKMDMLLVRPI